MYSILDFLVKKEVKYVDKISHSKYFSLSFDVATSQRGVKHNNREEVSNQKFHYITQQAYKIGLATFPDSGGCERKW